MEAVDVSELQSRRLHIRRCVRICSHGGQFPSSIAWLTVCPPVRAKLRSHARAHRLTRRRHTRILGVPANPDILQLPEPAAPDAMLADAANRPLRKRTSMLTNCYERKNSPEIRNHNEIMRDLPRNVRNS
jgi:hypothetical protein